MIAVPAAWTQRESNSKVYVGIVFIVLLKIEVARERVQVCTLMIPSLRFYQKIKVNDRKGSERKNPNTERTRLRI